jgi:hypothetical protein
MPTTPDPIDASFAFPLMHISEGSYTQFNGQFLKGRNFRQPLESAADKGDYASGIEMFIDVASYAKMIYSMFLGNIIWKNNKLILTPEPAATNSFAKLKLIEAMLGRVIFENLNPTSVAQALQLLIIQAWNAPAKDHPILKVNFKDSPKTIKQKLDAAANETKRVEIAGSIGNAFVGATPCKLMVKAGDYIGDADAYKASDWLLPAGSRPTWFKNPTDADRARRVTISIKDIGRHIINPYYYLHKYSATQTVLSIDKANHPLLHQGTPPVYGRELINGQYIFPIGWLNEFHKFPNSDADSIINETAPDAAAPAPGASLTPAPMAAGAANPNPPKKKWKYDDAGKFTVEGGDFDISSGPDAVAKFQRLKSMHFTYLNDFCSKSQLPLEILFGLLGAETSGEAGSVDARMEPLKNKHISMLNNAVIEHKYQKFIGIACEALSVRKNGDDYRFVVKQTDITPNHFPDTKMDVRVPMKLYYAADKYYLILKQKKPDGTPTIVLNSDCENGEMKATQAGGTKLFYPVYKKSEGKDNTAAVEKELTDSYVLFFNRQLHKVLDTVPAVAGNIKVTIYVNGNPTSMSFVLNKGRYISEADVYKCVWLDAGDKVCVCVETPAGVSVQKMRFPFLFNKRYDIYIYAKENDENASFNDIKKITSGMLPTEELDGGVVKYYPLGGVSAGKNTKEEVTPYKVPTKGFILIHDLKRQSTLSKPVKVCVWKRADSTKPYQLTAIVVETATDKEQVPISVAVKANEEVILEITTQAEPPPAAPPPPPPAPTPKKLKGLTVQFNFIPFDNGQSFFTSREAYSFNLLEYDRSDPTKPMATHNGRSLTWNQFYEFIDKTEGDRVSVGPNQFLVGTAWKAAKDAKHYLDEFGLPPFPTSYRAYIDVLSDGMKSMALGVADLRFHYNFSLDPKKFHTRSTSFDSPLVGSVHNARRNDNNAIKTAKDNQWGLVFADANAYIRNSASMINQAQEQYNETDCKPTVRFKK